MGKGIDKTTFEFLGTDFQDKLIGQLLTDKRFATKMMGLLDINYFDQSYRRTIVREMVNAWENNHNTILDIDSLLIRVRGTTSDSIKLKILEDFINDIPAKFTIINDVDHVRTFGLNFCRQQKLKVTIKVVDGIINTGNPDRYPECEDLIKKALELGQDEDDTIDVCFDVDSVLADDFRNPIPTGIAGLDEYMDGGLAKGELAVILAPFGVGKTTMMTSIANHAKDAGYNVLQIFFEDMPKVIQRKHLTCWYNKHNSEHITINELKDHKEEIKEIVDKKESSPGKIKLKKFASVGTTINKIRQYIRKISAQGFKPDIILLDYIDCVASSGNSNIDQNVAEGNIMREFETMLSELEIAGWTAVQGNRSSLNAETVDSSMMGGSIKRGQIGHFIVSVAKTLEQKEDGTATMAILKSRFGKDGIIFRDIVFDNGRIFIDLSKSGGLTFLEAKKDTSNKNQMAVNQALAIRKAKVKSTDANDSEIQMG